MSSSLFNFVAVISATFQALPGRDEGAEAPATTFKHTLLAVFVAAVPSSRPRVIERRQDFRESRPLCFLRGSRRRSEHYLLPGFYRLQLKRTMEVEKPLRIFPKTSVAGFLLPPDLHEYRHLHKKVRNGSVKK